MATIVDRIALGYEKSQMNCQVQRVLGLNPSSVPQLAGTQGKPLVSLGLNVIIYKMG